ncbi:hypothetical protein CR152_27930 [Massilia violaceinigra]|uniref:Chitin-binding type-3 domain-containing protein n=1 Tax=Massilia violaceinigra TaxID=2045208 RepID=A0A2D2DSF4_9BURK|nr:hypothetical protein [Massilia violaceinigra]ATQ77905.1 hypothetical protein CR152_27930 [Massilia violaceinigra]
MKVIKPTTITTAMLTSSTVAEPAAGEVAWNAATAYALGAVVIRTSTHMKYERAVAGTSATAPESDPTNWLPAGPTLRWGMFDRKIGTATTAATSITVVTQPGAVSGLGMLELVGRQVVVTLKNAPGGTTVYSRTVNLDGTLVTSVYDWFFMDFEQLTDFVLTDLPQHYASCELTVTITSTTPVSVGVLQVGQVLAIGRTIGGSTVGIIDYSRKERDRFGNFDVVEGDFSKRNSLQVLTAASEFNKIFRSLASLRAIPCIYIGADQIGYEPMINYGFYKDFSMVVAYPQHHLCNLEIEGLSQ